MTRRNCFYIDESASMVKLIDVVPRDRWMKGKGMITTSNNTGTKTREKYFLDFKVPDL